MIELVKYVVSVVMFFPSKFLVNGLSTWKWSVSYLALGGIIWSQTVILGLDHLGSPLLEVKTCHPWKPWLNMWKNAWPDRTIHIPVLHFSSVPGKKKTCFIGKGHVIRVLFVGSWYIPCFFRWSRFLRPCSWHMYHQISWPRSLMSLEAAADGRFDALKEIWIIQLSTTNWWLMPWTF